VPLHFSLAECPMGERALKFAVGRELGMDVTSSLAVLADRKSKFLRSPSAGLT
jgi:hypothetical protein